MGNSIISSSHHHHQNQQRKDQQHQLQQCVNNDLSLIEMGRGWTHSFPRELMRHHSQPTGHKVLPEPPNQRLRATNNGSIIHNGGTISGRRSSTLTLPHDLNKHDVTRNRTTSIANLRLSRISDHYHQNQQYQQYLPSSNHHHSNQSQISYCRHYRSGEITRKSDDQQICCDLKRFGSEPDLRHALRGREDQSEPQCPDSQPYLDHRDTRERERENRYRSKKKYKAPLPPAPAANGTEDGSSPDSIKWERDRDDCNSRGRHRTDPSTIHLSPPRRSRLFKTRAETKKTLVNWNCSSSSLQHPQSRDFAKNERRCSRQEVDEDEDENNSEPSNNWQREEDDEEEEEEEEGLANIGADWSNSRESSRSRYQIWESKNTLQRSMSTPEFQAELMQVAKKVRTKLQYCERGTPLRESATTLTDRKHSFGMNRSFQDFSKISRSRQQEIRMYHKRIIQNQRRRSDECQSNQERSLISAERDRVQYRNTKKQNFPKSYEVNSEFQVIGTIIPGEIDRLRLRDKCLEESHQRILSRKPLCERSKPIDRRWKADKKRIQFNSKKSNEDNKSLERLRSSRSSESPLVSPSSTCTITMSHMSMEKMEVRGQESGQETIPENSKIRRVDKENSDPRRRKENSREKRKCNEIEWQKLYSKIDKKVEGKHEKGESKEEKDKEKSRIIVPAAAFSKPKTFYFGMDDSLVKQSRECVNLENNQSHVQYEMDNRIIDDQGEQKNPSEIDDIALKLRPTLPKKQPEIPRFSPSAAWKLLSGIETCAPTTSTISEEIPVMFEERIERLSRPPPPLLCHQGPRSFHDKSGDSGISGDAGAVNDDSIDVSASPNRIKPISMRSTWTPQQDLGEESSSDAGLDSPPPPVLVNPVKFSTRPHVFSLSLPREENRIYLYNPEHKTKDIFSFHSLQKLKRSVSGAFGISAMEFEKKQLPVDPLDDNWLLSTSTPTSLQHNQLDQNLPYSELNTADEAEHTGKEQQQEIDQENKSDFSVPIKKPPSFSYLTSGGHVMYLPDSIRVGAEGSNAKHNDIEANYTEYKKNKEERNKHFSYHNLTRRSLNYSKYRQLGKLKNDDDDDDYDEDEEEDDDDDDDDDDVDDDDDDDDDNDNDNDDIIDDNLHDNDKKMLSMRKFSKSCENISYGAKSVENESFTRGPKDLQVKNEKNNRNNIYNNNNNQKATPTSKPKRFTFQSTVRQIERRRLADRLSREVEAKERQRKHELEAMRKVEEEFQKKRAREKANIRQQLRLYSMDENMSGLPTIWNNFQLSNRAEPDGAPSSSAPSPTSASPEKVSGARKNSASSEECRRKSVATLNSRMSHEYDHHHNREDREYKDYRPKYYDWMPADTSPPHIDYKKTTIHPKIIYDIPKSSPVFVDAKAHINKSININNATPKSDNYRKDFAHGAVAARSSLASSDSEISQPNTRPHSRQNGSKIKPLRSRSASPRTKRRHNEDTTASSESEKETSVEPITQERNPIINDFIFNSGVQPFSAIEKTYRPILFKL